MLAELAAVITIRQSLNLTNRDYELMVRLRLKEKQLRADLLSSESWSLHRQSPDLLKLVPALGQRRLYRPQSLDRIADPGAAQGVWRAILGQRLRDRHGDFHLDLHR